MIDIKYCKKCKRAFDIDTSKELCIECRIKLNEVKENDMGNKK